MKNQTHFFQKYQKKYFFFQKSFFDFLYWRSTKKRNSHSFPGQSESFLLGENEIKLNFSHKLYPFEQEKMSFYEYWKTSDSEKTKTLLKTSPNFSSLDGHDQSKTLKVFEAKKLVSAYSKSGGGFSPSKQSVLFLKKRKEKMSKRQNKNFQNDTFLPRNSFFELSQNLHFLKSQKIGEFFPKKKNFQQYWVFPFLGVLFFFSQNFSFRFFENHKNSQNHFSFEFFSEEKKCGKFQIFEKGQGFSFFPFHPQSGNKFSFLPQSKNHFQKIKQNEIESFEYSFAQKNFTETPFFQNLEKTEYEEFLKFYTKIFQNNAFFFESDVFTGNQPFFFQNENGEKKSRERFFSAVKKMHLQSSALPIFSNGKKAERCASRIKTQMKRFFLQQSFQKKLEEKRNCFHWKWLSGTSNFLKNPEQMIFISSQVPQKAEFFTKNFLFLKQPLVSRNQIQTKSHFFPKSSTPLFDYSKNLFFVDQVKRDLSFLPLLNSSTTSSCESFQFGHVSAEKNFSFSLEKMSKMQKFFQNSFPFLKNSHEEKNLYFLKKWSKTQKFSNLLFHQFGNSPKKKPFLKNKKIQKKVQRTKFEKSQMLNLYQSPSLKNTGGLSFFNSKNSKLSQKFMNLDALYFQKFFKNFKTQTLEKKAHFDNFQKSQNNLSGRVSGEKTFQEFFNLKKKTFCFFTFQNYKKNYKKFFSKNQKLKSCFFSRNKKKHETKKTHSFFYLQNKKELQFLFVEKNIFHKNEKIHSFEKNSVFENIFLFEFNQPLLFQFFQTEKNFQKFEKKSVQRFFEKPFFSNNKKNETRKFQANTNVYPHNFSSFLSPQSGFYGMDPNFQFSVFSILEERKTQNFFLDNRFFFPKECAFFPSEKKCVNADQNSENFSFLFSKSNFFKKFFGSSKKGRDQNFFEKTLDNFFSKVSKFENFQKNFLFETSSCHKPLLFQKKEHFWTSSPFCEKEKQNSLLCSKKVNLGNMCIQTNRFFLLKSKKRFSFLQYEIQKKGNQSNFLGFSKKQRQFEKTFRAFFSPLKDGKNDGSFELQQKQKIFQKNQKDFSVLQSLSLLLKKNPENFSSFYIPTQKKKSVIFLGVKRKKNSLFTPLLEETKVPNSLKKELQKNRLSPQLLLKKDGFLAMNTMLFLQQNDSKGLIPLSFQRLEKEKTFQKKRRLKKEKLETRRRKKRKRFFPRPLWLRMNLYKKFLKTRHSQKLSHYRFNQQMDQKKNSFFSFKKNLNLSSTLFLERNKKEKWFQNTEKKQLNTYFVKKFQPGFFSAIYARSAFKEKKKQMHLHTKRIQRKKGALHIFSDGKQKSPVLQMKRNFFKRSSDFQIDNVDSVFFKKQNSTFQNKTYQKNSQRKSWSTSGIANKSLFPFQKKRGLEKVSKNLNHYKISNEIYQEFLRLSWKSSWFQNHFKPYTETIQENFQKIQFVESQKSFSHFFDLFKNKNFLFFFHDFPIFSEQAQNNFLIRKSVFQKFSLYSNVQNSFSSRNVVHFPKKNIFSPQRGCSFFEEKKERTTFETEKSGLQSQKISEYNRLIYARISNILKKLKFSENMTNDSFFESFKGNRRENEKIFSASAGRVKNSFFTKTALFFEKFQVPSQPGIPAFSLFSSLFQNSSLKPTGDIPTLRAMWAFQKTNYSQFQERNTLQNLWAFKKQKDSFNSFKGTKKIMNFLRKYNAFEKFKAPQDIFSDFSFFVVPHSQKGNHFFLCKQRTDLWTKKSREISKDAMEKNFFFANKKTEFLRKNRGIFNTLDTMTLKKFQNLEKKSSLFGIQSFKQNSKISYRYFKFHLSPFSREGAQTQKQFSFPLNFENSFSQTFGKTFSGQEVHENIQSFSHFSPKLLRNKNLQNSAKSSFNFWWAQKPFQNFDFLGTSQFSTFYDFSNKMSFVSEKKWPTLQNQKDNFSFQDNLFVHPFSRGFEFTISFFLFGAFFFHFALFYTLFKIPEIRSVFKFTLFIFSKLWNSFFVVFFSIYNIFKRYTKNGFNLLKNSSSPQSGLQSGSKNKKMDARSTVLPFFTHGADECASHVNRPLNFFSMRFFFPKERTSCVNAHGKKGNEKLNFQNAIFQSFGFSKNPKFFKSSLSDSKFNDLVFEFFPRFSAFSLNQEKLVDNFEPFSNFQKSQAYFSQKSNPFSFQSQFDFQKNFRQIFSYTKIFKNFFSPQHGSSFFTYPQSGQKKMRTAEWENGSFFLFKTSPYELLFPIFQEQDGFSQDFQFKNFQRRFFSFEKKLEKSPSFPEQKLSKMEKNLSQFALSFLVFGKHILLVPYRLFQFASSFFTKIFEIIEGIFYAFYKFLEKPAEFMIEFIAFVFLIEWSSDILGFFPDSIESSMWKSSQKLLRPVRTGSFFLSFGIFFLGTSSKTFLKSSSFLFQTRQNFSVLNPFQFLFSTGFFQFSNFAGYVLQKRLFYVFENVPSLLLQPDIDILVRQRKGILFWDIWSEILLKAAEKYNVNLPSFVTLKEEQELFLEKLVRDSQFFESFNPQHSQKTSQNTFFSSLQIGRANTKSLPYGIKKKSFEKIQNSAKSFSSFLQNFVIQNRPVSFFDFYFLSQSNSSFFFQKFKNTQKFKQFSISNLFSSSFDSKTDFQKFSPFSMPFEKQQNASASFYTQSAFKEKRSAQKMLFSQGEILQKNEISNSFFPLFQSQSQNVHSSQRGYSFFEEKKHIQTFRDIGKNISFQESFSSFQVPKKEERWECNQYTTFQSQETDFFLDIYPPKSLKHVHFLKYFEPSHYTLGSFICQIYAGLFPKQVSKNILVVGESGTAKTFFLRALAGETEMKIITENASRYAIVQRGVAVGMKYLRDVFDAIALQTPCFFVMEDLHILGAKRPFMISENENTQNNQSSFGLEQQEVHETNQMIYQSSRHSLSDFRRPYKGDFSMGIPTNYFLQTFYSPFFSSYGGQNRTQNSSHQQVGGDQDFSFSLRSRSSQKNIPFQNSQFYGGNFSSSVWNSLSSPLPIDSLEAILQNSGIQEREKSHFESFSTKKKKKKIQSLLQFSKEQIFAPPATSPFTVLMMKEQKKLKPKKIVQETSWGGFSVDQILSQGSDQKESFSIRAKIAVLAEKTMNLSRGKFDMITDFLVIIDSVRSNRGFVVFGTTHKPSSLDPALRRPGRFDETLSLSRTPNFQNRFEIFKMNFENSVSTFDFFDSSIFTENFSEMDLFDVLSQTKLSFFHNYKYSFQKSLRREAHCSGNQKDSFSLQSGLQSGSEGVRFARKSRSILGFKTSDIQRVPEKESEKSFFHLMDKKQMYSQISPAKAFHALLKSPLLEDFYTQKQFTLFSSKYTSFSKNVISPLRNSNFFFDQRYTLLPKGPSHMLSSAYSKLGVFLAQANFLYDPFSFVPLKLDIDKNSSKCSNFQKYYGNLFFDPAPHLSTFQSNGTQNQKNSQLLLFLSGKVAEFLICSSNQKNFSFCSSGTQFSLPPTAVSAKMNSFSTFEIENSFLFEKPFSFFSEKFGIFENSFEQTSAFQKNSTNSIFGQKSFQNFFSPQRRCSKYTAEKLGEQKTPNMSQVQESFSLSSLQGKKNFYWTVYGNEESWRSATPFLHTLIQKRFFFTKNLLLSKMLFFENTDQRRKPPNPPGSSILMPSKKYENLKRTETDFFQKAHFSIHEKIHMHQKQRFLKQLYNIPVQTHFRSELRKNHKTLFSSSFQEFAYLDSFVQKSSSSHSYYRKYIQVRHRFSNVNQWWNGMFPEHTRETTYLSDVDWRTMFVSSKVDSKSQKMNQEIELENSTHKQMENVHKSSTETFEFLMDFPDAEQYYNPRNRRWFFKSNFQFANQVSTNSSFWSIFEKDLQYEIFSHYLMESFYQSFSYFEKKREMLDFFAFHLLSKGFLKEFDFLTTFSRF